MNLAYGQGGLKLEINIPPQHISAKSKGGLIIEGGVSSSEYGNYMDGSLLLSCTTSTISQALHMHSRDFIKQMTNMNPHTQNQTVPGTICIIAGSMMVVALITQQKGTLLLLLRPHILLYIHMKNRNRTD